MQHSHRLRTIVKATRLSLLTTLLALTVVVPPVIPQTVVPVAPFRAIKLQDGGFVTLRHGETQRVSLLKGDQNCAGFTTADDGELIIQKYKGRCPHGYRLEVEIITPTISRIEVADGGTIRSDEGFTGQTSIRVVVRNGGSIDIRAIPADNVIAAIEQGGLILAMPRLNLFARVVQGGQIHYWGDPRVESSVQHGGSVSKGVPPEASKKFSEH